MKKLVDAPGVMLSAATECANNGGTSIVRLAAHAFHRHQYVEVPVAQFTYGAYVACVEISRAVLPAIGLRVKCMTRLAVNCVTYVYAFKV